LPDFSNHLPLNIFSLSLNPQEMHHPSTAFAQPAGDDEYGRATLLDLDRHIRAHYA